MLASLRPFSLEVLELAWSVAFLGDRAIRPFGLSQVIPCPFLTIIELFHQVYRQNVARGWQLWDRL